MRRAHLMARLSRALAGQTQEKFGESVDIHPSLISQIELGLIDAEAHLSALTGGAGLTVADADALLAHYEALRQARKRRREGEVELSSGLATPFTRLLALPRPPLPPRAEDRQQAAEQWRRLESLPEEARLAVVQVAEEFQTWALCELVCAESVCQLARAVEPAAALVRLAEEIAAHARGPEGFLKRLQGYAAVHRPNVLRVAGELGAARAALGPARQLWEQGSDPDGLLDPGRLLDLEGSLCRDERRFDEALACLDAALAVSHQPGRVLIKKGFTFEVMGRYERAAATLLEAAPLVEREAEPRNWSFLRLNLANVRCHLGQHGEARALLEEVRPHMARLGDEIDTLRFIGLEGRIAAGERRTDEARRLLAEARQGFAARRMTYDVALVLLEELTLLLAAGRTAEVKPLARELYGVFEEKGVHREALAALRLFEEATQRETATAAMARRVLGYLYRARHDPGLAFTAR